MFDRIVARLHEELALPSSTSAIEDLIALGAAAGLDPMDLRADVEAVLTQRIALWCVGDVVRNENFGERKARLSVRLRRLFNSHGFVPSQGLTIEMADASRRYSEGGQGIRRTIDNMDAVTRREMLNGQGSRCAVCGVPLEHVAVRDSVHFASGREPQFTATLEHVEPFSLVGNDTRYEILCRPCNGLKRERLGVQEDGVILSGNLPRSSTTPSVNRRVMFWTLYRTRRCNVTACPTTSRESMLFVDARGTKPLTYGNGIAMCSEHRSASATWLHDGLHDHGDVLWGSDE